MTRSIIIMSLVMVLCLCFSLGVWAEEAEVHNPGADKIVVDKESNTITFVYDESDKQLMNKLKGVPTYGDVQSNAWYQLYVSHLTQLDIINGINETDFAPNQSITRAEFAKMITLTADADLSNCSGATLFTDVEPTAWYAPSMEWASDNGIIINKEVSDDNIYEDESFHKEIADQ